VSLLLLLLSLRGLAMAVLLMVLVAVVMVVMEVTVERSGVLFVGRGRRDGKRREVVECAWGRRRRRQVTGSGHGGR